MKRLLIFCAAISILQPVQPISTRSWVLAGSTTGVGLLYGALRLWRAKAERELASHKSLSTLAEQYSVSGRIERAAHQLALEHDLVELNKILRIFEFGGGSLTVLTLASLVADWWLHRQTGVQTPVSPAPLVPPAPPLNTGGDGDKSGVKPAGKTSGMQPATTASKKVAAKVRDFNKRVIAAKSNKNKLQAHRPTYKPERYEALIAQAEREWQQLSDEQLQLYQDILTVPEKDQHSLIVRLNGDNDFGAFETKPMPQEGWQHKPVDLGKEPIGKGAAQPKPAASPKKQPPKAQPSRSKSSGKKSSKGGKRSGRGSGVPPLDSHSPAFQEAVRNLRDAHATGQKGSRTGGGAGMPAGWANFMPSDAQIRAEIARINKKI